MSETYQIGRKASGNELTHVFDIRRTDDGGIKLSKVVGLGDAERQMLLAHFGRPQTIRTGGRDGDEFWEGFKEAKPGTREHFLHAVNHIPGFVVMG